MQQDVCMYVCMRGGPQSGPCIATVADLLCFLWLRSRILKCNIIDKSRFEITTSNLSLLFRPRIDNRVHCNIERPQFRNKKKNGTIAFNGTAHWSKQIILKVICDMQASVLNTHKTVFESYFFHNLHIIFKIFSLHHKNIFITVKTQCKRLHNFHAK
jgi:hypothetical protein